MSETERYRFEVHVRPGLYWTDATRARIVEDLRTVGRMSLSPLPDYQCFVGTREELSDKVISLAFRADGTLAGFCSAVLLPIAPFGDVLHLGLVCVRPDARGALLSYSLVTQLVTRYLLRHRPFATLWVTNVACLLTSLANFALNFRDVHPSPLNPGGPGKEHRIIAEAFERSYRAKAYVQPAAIFDSQTYVFKGSGRGTAFQKRADDARYHHRSSVLNEFYRRPMRFDDGDEMLQIGSVSLLDGLLFLVGGRARTLRRLEQLR